MIEGSVSRIWQELSQKEHGIISVRQQGHVVKDHCPPCNNLYFNWDIAEHRALFFENPSFFEGVERKDDSVPLIIMDEIHKFRDWKNYLKGVYDRYHENYKFLITGSGRLDVYQKGGDSLAGRYYIFHIFPFTIAELGKKRSSIKAFLSKPLEVNKDIGKDIKEKWEMA